MVTSDHLAGYCATLLYKYKLQSPENFLDMHLGHNILTVIAIAMYMAMANKSCMWIAFFSLPKQHFPQTSHPVYVALAGKNEYS